MDQVINYLTLRVLETYCELSEVQLYTPKWYNKLAEHRALKDVYDKICDEDILFLDWQTYHG